MDLRHMRHFVTVAEELHFGRAARRLNIAQPALSQSIQRLEGFLDGAALLERSRRGVALTRAGEIFRDQARRTLAAAELAFNMARREALVVPEIRIGFVGPALYRILPGVIARHRQEVPEIHLRLSEVLSTSQAEMIATGDLDIGFAHPMPKTGKLGLETLAVERTPIMAVVPANWPVAQQASVSLAELAELPFIRPPARYAESNIFIDYFQRAGVMPRIAQEATQINTAISLVGAGVGCTMATASAAHAYSGNVQFVPLRDACMHDVIAELHMAWHPELINTRARAFIAFVRGYIIAHPQLLDETRPHQYDTR